MNNPIRPGFYSKLDMLDGLHEVDEVRSPYPPVSASAVRVQRLAHERMLREQRAERRAEAKATLLVAAFIATVGCVWKLAEWALYVLAVHP